jgi:phage/plasmid-like protein (TIGR03299 family)
MAHLLESMAYVGETPWHDLGSKLPPKQPIEVWADKAGMNWNICSTPVRYMTEQAGTLGAVMSFAEQMVLYRSDTKAPLSVVSDRYQVVQPREVLEFYRDLTEVSGFELETAGVLKSGKKFWALARTGKETVLKGNDVVKGYLLLATSCDGTLATTATPTTVRVVCNNTLAIALNGASSAIKVPHRTSFDALAVKKQLGIAVSQWDSFMYRMKTLSERRVKSYEAMNYFLKVICQSEIQGDSTPGLNNERALKKVQA